MRPYAVTAASAAIALFAAPALAWVEPGASAKVPVTVEDVETAVPLIDVVEDYEVTDTIVPPAADADKPGGDDYGAETAPVEIVDAVETVEDIKPAGDDAGDALPADPTRSLDEAQIRTALTDQSLFGCFTDGEQWGERTSSEGLVYNLLAGGAEIGRWSAAGDQVCYVYGYTPGLPVEDCFSIRRVGEHLDFYLSATGELAASTDCSGRVVTGVSPRAPAPAEAPADEAAKG